MTENLIQRAHRLVDTNTELSKQLKNLMETLSIRAGSPDAHPLSDGLILSLDQALGELEAFQGEWRSRLRALDSSLDDHPANAAVQDAQADEVAPPYSPTVHSPMTASEESPAWLDQIVSLGPSPTSHEHVPDFSDAAEKPPRHDAVHAHSSISESPVAPPPEPTHRHDHWDALQIGNFRESGAPSPMAPIAQSSAADDGRRRRRQSQSLHPPEALKTSGADDLERAVDELLSTPPQAMSPPKAEVPRTFHLALTEHITSAAITHKGVLLTAHTAEVGPSGVVCTVSKHIPAGERVHVFFALPDGTEVAAHCHVQAVHEAEGSSHELVLEFIDLTHDANARLVDLVYSSRRDSR